jgi:hypothetical protein
MKRNVVGKGVEGAIEIEPFAEFPDPGIAGWLRDSHDAWLRERVTQKLAVRCGWTNVVAAGMVARLEEPTAAEARAQVADLLAGRPSPLHVVAPRQWARTWTGAQVRTARDFAWAEVDVLHKDFDDLRHEAWYAEDPTRAVRLWREACARRDDLEGVRLLLHEAGNDDLAFALECLDADARLAEMTVPVHAQTERQRRAWLRDPFAWWGNGPVGEV